MDLGSIPRMQSVVLSGLDFSMRPEFVRYELAREYISPLPDERVIHKIKKYAIMVYNQEKFTPMQATNPLAYFLCAVHRQAAPQPQKKKDNHASIASNASSDSGTSSCPSDSPGKHCELPQLCSEAALPLGYWDSVYYALLAEIRRLHDDLQEKFGWAIEQGTQPLHYFGADGIETGPIAPIELASMLETAWYELMDNRLVAALDDAVRMRKIRECAQERHHSGLSRDDNHEFERPPVVQGLVDVNGMTAQGITSMLWEKHALEVNRACAENFEDSSMFTIYRSELQAQAKIQAAQFEAEAELPLSNCKCHGRCTCRLRCNVHTSHCDCGPRKHIYRRLPNDALDAQAGIMWQDVSHREKFGGDDTDAITQMTMSSSFHSSSMQAAQMPHNAFPARPQERSIPSRHRTRQRTETTASELAYVPNRDRTRGRERDAYPLDFYSSPGRYPRMHDNSASEYIATTAPLNVPRKPLPPPKSPPRPRQARDERFEVITPPSESRYQSAEIVAARAHHAYLDNYRMSTLYAQNHGHFGPAVESFSATNDATRRMMTNDPFMDNVAPSAEEYSALLAQHPSSFDTVEESNEPFPSFTRALTMSPSPAGKPYQASASTADLTTLRALTGEDPEDMPPVPPMPENLPPPNFNAPRPAPVQRYVSAGGNLPLSQRPQIAGPAFIGSSVHNSAGNSFVGMPGTVTPGTGITVSKDEIDAKMGDPEWLERTFGKPPPAARVSNERTSPRSRFRGGSGGKKVRGSADSDAGAVNSRGASARVSAEQQQGGRDIYNPRGRTSSGVSAVGAKIKRVFSRKNSESIE